MTNETLFAVENAVPDVAPGMTDVDISNERVTMGNTSKNIGTSYIRQEEIGEDELMCLIKETHIQYGDALRRLAE